MRLLTVGDVITTTSLGSGAEHVVEHTVLDGGGQQLEMTGHYSHFPNGHHVHVRRLAPDGTYDPEGMVADFWQTGCFVSDRMIKPEDVSIVRKMHMRFVEFEPESPAEAGAP